MLRSPVKVSRMDLLTGTGQDPADSRSRRSAPSLRPPGSVVHHCRSSLPPNARHRSSSSYPLTLLQREPGLTVQGRRPENAGRPTAPPPTRLGVLDLWTDLGCSSASRTRLQPLSRGRPGPPARSTR